MLLMQLMFGKPRQTRSILTHSLRLNVYTILATSGTPVTNISVTFCG